MSNTDIIREEIESIIADVKKLYIESCKKTSGNWEKELEVVYSDNRAEIYSYPYLAGRAAGKMPPVKAIKKWIELKGIKPLKGNTTSLAWAIAKSIAKKGTNPKYHLQVFEQVLTPERIQSVIDKVSQFNVNLFINEVTVNLNKLTTNL